MSKLFNFEEFKAHAIEQLKAEVSLSSKGDVLAPLFENLLNRSPEGEMDSHLEECERELGNRRNGHMNKQAQTSIGETTINTSKTETGHLTSDCPQTRKDPYINQDLQQVLQDEFFRKYKVGEPNLGIACVLLCGLMRPIIR